MKSNALYIHIPFCVQKCNYCNFASGPYDAALHSLYLNALENEFLMHKNFKAQTLYIGGGTPSVLSPRNLTILLENIQKNFGPVKDFKEATFEANPESLTQEKLQILKDFGFNRLSLGLQSTDDKNLKFLGRVHDFQTFLTACHNAQAAGFDNINVDLISCLPGQSAFDFEREALALIALKPCHISAYSLIVEEGTLLYKTGIRTDDNTAREILELTRNVLTGAGYKHYEISNYSLPGYESMHNNAYWLGYDYLGLGLAAASYINGARISNTQDINDYINKLTQNQSPAVFEEKLEGKEHVGELVMAGLRRLDGIVYTAEIKQYFEKEVDGLVSKNLLERSGKNIKLTNSGLYLANQVFSAFVAPFD